ncbi:MULTISPECIES: GNAT family N-acetyltransferase [Microbacterium]|uniref:GNAT family N-acetyltransferase n=1 Tax=Microbacterium aquilitoris TaxID=3067307 RepID=A0ABU3GKP2_9MICO|nr:MULTISPECIES: GNAT family N-acetyltransferase [unclassified Microbacterium]MDT3330119.1 GNAT family N-acetyltransferase [Microbacterium sp. KSW-18]MDT3345952.1 GNAT family N-acetyltransferase [Microbacterium sp. KSW2-22]SDG85784.1 Acetyltransferase (GNAT) family protein [Microbacterium sp. 77mftsu3.1]
MTAAGGIRPFRPGDEPALSEICLRTADAGSDATGIFEDDAIWGHIWALPYAERHPDLVFVVEDGNGTPVGYVVATDDTDGFEEWFRTQWWPRFANRWPKPEAEVTRQDGTLLYAYGRGEKPERYAADFPAHLHIDLLPQAQGQGAGRRLIETLFAALRERGVAGLHLVASAENTGAMAFYTRLGFAALPSSPGSSAYGMRL